MLIPVIVFWLAVFGYVPYHFRKCEPVREFFVGFAAIWLSVFYAEDKTIPANASDAFDKGACVGAFSVIVVIVSTLIFAATTIYFTS